MSETLARPKQRLRGNALVVFATAVLTAGLTGPGQTIGVAVFIDHFVDDLGLSRPEVSTAYLIGTLTGSLLLPSVGRFIDRYGVRRSQLIVGVLFAGALVNMSTVQGFVTISIGFIGIRFLGQGSLSLVSTVTVQQRFDTNRGTMLGLFSTFTAGLLALAPIALAFAISLVGWRSAWLIAALAIAATVTPLAFLGLRSMPTTAIKADVSDTSLPALGYTRNQAIRTRGFWILVAISATAGMLSTALNFHQIDLLTDAGLTTTAAASMFLPQVIGSTIAGFGFGVLLDRLGSRLLPAISVSLLVVAHVLAAIAAPGLTVVLYAITLGAAGGAIRTVATALLPEWFGLSHIGSIQGTLTFLNIAASATGPVVLALLQEQVGSYPPAVLILAVIPLAAAVFALAPPGVRPLAEDRAHLSQPV